MNVREKEKESFHSFAIILNTLRISYNIVKNTKVMPVSHIHRAERKMIN